MATTTNYGWTTPDDTALVKDGAAAIRTLGSSVDTTTKNLNPETTLGDIAYRSSTANVNTRLALGTAGQVLKVNSGATAPEWSSDNAGMTNPMTTTGDTIYSSSGSTPARLGIGTTGQVLTVAAGLPSWATASSGGMTLITSANLTGASVVLSSIPQTYNHLQLVIREFIPATDSRSCVVRFNGDTSNKYNSGLSTAGNQSFGASSIVVIDTSDDGFDRTLGVLDIYDYTNTTTWKVCHGTGIAVNTTTTANFNSYVGGAYWGNTSAITSITVTTSGGNFTDGVVLLYGVK
jgi:hypothetical protein